MKILYYKDHKIRTVTRGKIEMFVALDLLAILELDRQVLREIPLKFIGVALIEPHAQVVEVLTLEGALLLLRVCNKHTAVELEHWLNFEAQAQALKPDSRRPWWRIF